MKINPKERLLVLRQRQFEEELKQMQMKDLEIVYKDILAAIRKYAVENGYDLILWRHGDVDEETWELARQEGNLMSHRYMVDIRPILYAGDGVPDVTEDLEKILATP